MAPSIPVVHTTHIIMALSGSVVAKTITSRTTALISPMASTQTQCHEGAAGKSEDVGSEQAIVQTIQGSNLQ